MKRAKSTRPADCPYVSKGGLKLAFALERFGVDPTGLTVADLGCHKGGFTDCLLQHGAAKVYAVDTGYGILDWNLRNHARVVVRERANAMHWIAPELLDLIVIDAGWTRQEKILPAALKNLKPAGRVVSLVKPQYEAARAQLKRGVLPQDQLEPVMRRVRETVSALTVIRDEAPSPLAGSGGNREVWLLLGNW